MRGKKDEKEETSEICKSSGGMCGLKKLRSWQREVKVDKSTGNTAL